MRQSAGQRVSFSWSVIQIVVLDSAVAPSEYRRHYGMEPIVCTNIILTTRTHRYRRVDASRKQLQYTLNFSLCATIPNRAMALLPMQKKNIYNMAVTWLR